MGLPKRSAYITEPSLTIVAGIMSNSSPSTGDTPRTEKGQFRVDHPFITTGVVVSMQLQP